MILFIISTWENNLWSSISESKHGMISRKIDNVDIIF